MLVHSCVNTDVRVCTNAVCRGVCVYGCMFSKTYNIYMCACVSCMCIVLVPHRSFDQSHSLSFLFQLHPSTGEIQSTANVRESPVTPAYLYGCMRFMQGIDFTHI